MPGLVSLARVDRVDERSDRVEFLVVLADVVRVDGTASSVELISELSSLNIHPMNNDS